MVSLSETLGKIGHLEILLDIHTTTSRSLHQVPISKTHLLKIDRVLGFFWFCLFVYLVCFFCFHPFLKRTLAQKQKCSNPHVSISLLCTKENYILEVLEGTVTSILHIYCALLGELGGEKDCVVHICSGYCLCRSDWMKEQWVSFQFLMSTSNYLFNFMPGEALYSYTQNHFTSFVMLCFLGDWLAFQLTALITTWIWLHCRGINIMQQSI